MTSDLPSQTGPLEPGLDQLVRALTAPGTADELTGEQDVLAMFRVNIAPPGSSASAPADLGGQPARSPRFARPFRLPVRWSVRLAAAAALAVGGTAAAAYAAALPTPVQHLAHSVLGFAGVPDAHQGSSGTGRSGHHGDSAAGHRGPSPAGLQPSGAATRPPSGTGGAPVTPTASALAAGQLLLSATAASAQITAGGSDVIDGRLTSSGAGVPGRTVQLVERLAGQWRWHVVGSGQTTSDGNVAVSVPALTENAVFRLAISGTAVSPPVPVTVSPPISTVLNPDQGGALDSLVVTAQYAHIDDVVVIQVLTGHGSWAYLRSGRLNASGQATFSLSGARLGNRQVRAVLIATVRHAAAVSSPVVVPPPG